MLYYEIHDNGKSNWVVFVHGIGGSTKTWKKQIKDFSKDYNLLLLDLPGHGKSDSLPQLSIQSVNAAIVEVMDHAGIASADFVALSLGTMVASYFAVQYPERVKSLIQGGATLRVDGFNKFLMNVAESIKKVFPCRMMYNIFARVIMPKKNHSVSRKIFVRESLKMKRKDFSHWVHYLHESVNPGKLLQGLKKLNIKMYFISGQEDVCFLRGVKKCVELLPQSTLSVIQKCGHVCTIEKAREFNCMALLFLRRERASAA